MMIDHVGCCSRHTYSMIETIDSVAGTPGTGLILARNTFAADLQNVPLQRVQEKQWGQKDKLSRGERGWPF